MATSSSTRRRDAGFTFAEVLLVLFVVSVITAVVAAAAGRLPPAAGPSMFFEEQLKTDIQTVQAYALANRSEGRIVFRGDRKGYQGAGPGKVVLFEREFPEGITLSPFGNTLKTVAFNSNGSVLAFGTVYFNTPAGTRTMRVHIGKGRVRFEG
ncbi:GspH/FimT family protein [Bhargavaea ullalensis]|uniref:Competence protein ComGD n=1 Tax=Bhargavaea ullalensis TaxID=1265685 RepID=A0ABV2G929_9BACL